MKKLLFLLLFPLVASAQVTLPVKQAYGTGTAGNLPMYSDSTGLLVGDSGVHVTAGKIDEADIDTAIARVADVQPADTDLDIFAGITPSANVQTLLAAADFAAFVQSLSLEIGVDTQAYDADLDTLAAVTVDADAAAFLADAPTANTIPAQDGSGWTQLPYTTSGAAALAATGETGSGNLVYDDSPTLITPEIGAATGTSLALTGVATGQAFVPAMTDLAGGTVLSRNTVYFDDFAANRTLTFDWTSPVNGESIVLVANCTAAVTLTVPSSYPVLGSGANTTMYLAPGLNTVVFRQTDGRIDRSSTEGGVNNVEAGAPGVTNDVDEGYQPGSTWVDITTDPAAFYVCQDASDGAAVWTELGAGATGGGILTGTIAPDNGDGDDGNTYLNTTNGILYLKASSTWGAIGQIVAVSAVTTLSGSNVTLTTASARTQLLTPDANRDVSLPASGLFVGDTFTVNCGGGTAFTLTVKTSGGTTLASLPDSTTGTFIWNGTTFLFL